MSTLTRLAILSAGLLAMATPAARADDLAAVTGRVSLAATNVSSFVIHIKITGTTGVGGSLTFVRPMSMKSEYTIGEMSVQTYLVDGTLYIHAPGGGWQMTKIDAVRATPQSINIAEGLKSSKVTLLPDRQEDGTTVGAMQIETHLPAAVGPIAQSVAQQKLLCTYDKSSYLMRTCASSLMTMTYSNYNDSANSVVLPPEAKSATPMVLPSPTGASPVPLAAPSDGSQPSPVPVPSPAN